MPSGGRRILVLLLLLITADGSVFYKSNEAVRPFAGITCDNFVFTAGCSCDTEIDGLHVVIKDGYERGKDELTCGDCANHGVLSVMWDGQRGRLKLVAATTLRQYVAALAEALEFKTTSTDKGDREVTYHFADADYLPANGHFYKVVACRLCNWLQGQVACAEQSRDRFGLVGYLATITDATERDIIVAMGTGGVWVGGTDAGEEGYMRWVTGPEGVAGGCADYDVSKTGAERSMCNHGLTMDSQNCCTGSECKKGTLIATGYGDAVKGWPRVDNGYVDWADTFSPNDIGHNGGEDFLVLTNSGGWNDVDYLTKPSKVLCEWGGVGTPCVDPTGLTGTTTLWGGDNECEAHGAVCAAAGETCVDPSPGRRDWQCQCTPPSASPDSPATAWSVGTCALDECAVECATCSCTDSTSCTCAAADQDCTDPNTAVGSTRDWMCSCRAPLSGTSARAAAASCVLDECTATCATCEQDACAPADQQQCVEGVTSPTSVGDWSCVCTTPYSGTSPAAAASCTLDECEAACPSCEMDECTNAATAQTCRDPSIAAAAIADWVCECTPPLTGSATTSVAMCTLNECSATCGTCAGTTCRDADQFCRDSDKSPDATGDWVCECRAPTTGTPAMAAPATCELDECTVSCATCEKDVCAPADQQTCVEGSTAVDMLGDWTCSCSAPYTGSGPADVAVCALDECEATCPSCEMDACTNAASAQTCRDPDTGAAAVGDWQCLCSVPAKGQAQAMVATCILNECSASCGTCAGTTCEDAGQDCRDVDQGATGDWVCECRAPTTGTAATAAPAMCELDECTATCGTCAAGACPAPQQACADANTAPASTGDWVCSCVAPTTGTATAAPAACVLDECEAACPSCEMDACTPPSQQKCNDPDTTPDATGDWRCECTMPFVGFAVAAPATCVLDECDANCGTCAGTTCTGAGQNCTDVDTSPNATGDWVCACEAPGSGSAIAAAAVCTLDECKAACPSCENDVCTPRQACADPDTSAAATGDWVCVCNAPYEGRQVGQVATCVLEECTAVCPSCANTTCSVLGQTCVDPNPDPDVTEDWVCGCPPPFNGSGAGAAAECTIDECGASMCASCAMGTCEAAGQTCDDPNHSALHLSDWVCSCALPATGNATAAPASCGLDECAVADPSCATCAFTTCSAAGQDCRDPDTRDDSPGDWVCECRSPGRGSRVGAPAVCALDECRATCATCAGATCSDAGQTCADPDHAATGDWTCTCAGPSVGVETGAPAMCVLDECVSACGTCAGTTCADADQTCADANTDASATRDWECRCRVPLTGTAVAVAASCALDECAATCTTCALGACAAPQQSCADADRRPTSTRDWTCSCVAPLTGSATAGAAACALDECSAMCDTCAGSTCGAAGQTCEDSDTAPDAKGDWTCVCVAPEVGMATGAAATCLLDECDATCVSCEDGTCGTVLHQECDDPNTAATSTGDWECRCVAPFAGRSTAAAAACELDECEAVCSTCEMDACAAAAHPQTCIDAIKTPTATGTWVCECTAPLMGSATAGAASCTLDECGAACSTCAGGACGGNASCTDSNTSPDSTRDWQCVCTSPYNGSATAAPVVCELDECRAVCATCAGTTCADAGQACMDPNKAAGSTGDWVCECRAPQNGTATGAAADCELDECADACATCPYTTCDVAGQVCVDADLAVDARGTWECRCTAPLRGTARAGVGNCSLNECAEQCDSCANTTCSSVGQTCEDPTAAPEETGDWVCLCPPPATGRETAAAATCTFDECARSCDTCANGMCAAAQQTCVDTNPSPDARRDWECACSYPNEGIAIATVAACILDECAQACGTCEGGTCARENQTCNDPNVDTTSLSDWTCTCGGGVGGTMVAAAAVCVLDECKEVCATCELSVCADAGQECWDVDTAPDALEDWVCVCEPPFAKVTATGAPCVPPAAKEGPTPAPEVLPTARAVELAGMGAVVAAPQSGMRLIVLQMTCGAAPEGGYPWWMHPTQWAIDGSDDAGMVVGNLFIAAAVCALSGIAYGVASHFAWGDDSAAMVRVPSVPIFAFQVLHVGTTLGAMRSIMRAPTTTCFAIGALGFGACCGVPMRIFRGVRNGVPASSVYVSDPRTGGRASVAYFLCGPGEWVNVTFQRDWVSRWSLVILPYRQPTAWWLFLEFLTSLTISALHAVDATDSPTLCGHQKVAAGLVFFSMAAIEAMCRPFSRYRDLCAMVLVNVLQGAAMAFMAVGYYAENDEHDGFAIAGVLLLVVAGLLGVKTLLDAAMWVYILCTARRARLQEAVNDKLLAAQAGDGFTSVVMVSSPRDEGMDTSTALSTSLMLYGEHTNGSSTSFAHTPTAETPSRSRNTGLSLGRNTATPTADTPSRSRNLAFPLPHDAPPPAPSASVWHNRRGSSPQVARRSFSNIRVPAGRGGELSETWSSSVPSPRAFSPKAIPRRPSRRPR